jgi:hypothetical protein
MIVIIEGADLVGKTTLAGLMATAHGWPIAKIRWALRGDPEIETRAMATATVELLRATRPDVIFDRIFFSWWAYGPVLGHDVGYIPELIEEFAVVPDARLILLTATSEALEQRYAIQPDLYFPLEVIQAANERFPSLLPLLPPSLPALHLDTTALAPGELVAEAESFLANEALVGRG